jgi:hypothetical protein
MSVERRRTKKTMVFTIGRMNPPTIGHMELIKIMMETSLTLPMSDAGRGQIYVILSNKQDGDNPLTCPEKRIYLEHKGMLQKIKRDRPELNAVKVKVVCMDAETSKTCEGMYKVSADPAIKIKPNPILNQLCFIVETEPDITHAQLIVGEDRQKEFSWLGSFFTRNDIFMNEDMDKTEEINSLLRRPKLSAEEKEAYINDDTLEIPLQNMSATIMRGLVREGKLAKFKKLVEQSGLSPKDAEELFYEIDYNLKSVAPSKTTVSKTVSKTTASKGTASKGTASKAKKGGKSKRKTVRVRKTKRNSQK